MDAATDLTRPDESAQASSATVKDGCARDPYRQDPGTILLAATPIGDVRDTSLRQVVTAAGDGARAAMSAYAYLQR